MDIFFDELKELYKKEQLSDCANGLIKDGIIDEIEYNSQKNKVLFIAKEHNHIGDFYQDGDYRVWWKQHVHLTFSHRVSEWAYGIINGFPDYHMIKHVDKEIALKSIAFINIKKTYGGASSDPIVLSNYLSLSKSLLQQQIHSISPTIILCCLRYDHLTKQLFDFDNMIPAKHGFSYQKWHDSLVINFYHPSARKNKSVLYSQLKEVVDFAISDSLCKNT